LTPGTSPTAGWVYSDSLMSVAFGSLADPASVGGGSGERGKGGMIHTDVYPLFYIRYAGMLASTPWMLQNLCVVAAADRPTIRMAHFLNACIWIALFAGMPLSHASKPRYV